MPYSITYKPKKEIYGISPTTATIDKAAAAWAFIQHIEASNDIVTTIYDAKWRNFLDKDQLQALAREEAHDTRL